MPILALTPGEPAGIGPDLVAHLVGLNIAPPCPVVVIADAAMLAARARSLGHPWHLPPWPETGSGEKSPQSCGYYSLSVPCKAAVTPGRLDAANSHYVLATLDRAITGCLSGEFTGLVTGPLHKGIINEAGLPFTGHTEFLSRKAGGVPVVMMLACPGLRVALATTHLPLSAVPAAITRERLTTVIGVLHRGLQLRLGIANPRILVCGLNPHAGESGHMGTEEIEVIEPLLHDLRARGMQLTGPAPADTAFLPAALDQHDAVLAMYHDQGLPVLKARNFSGAVNITLGLPFVRTSVDHGTALPLAGTGQADDTSLRAALTAAFEMTARA